MALYIVRCQPLKRAFLAIRYLTPSTKKCESDSDARERLGWVKPTRLGNGVGNRGGPVRIRFRGVELR